MKAHLQTIIFTALVVFAAFSAITYSACTQDKCANAACPTKSSTCIDGFCQCYQGYEGPHCETVTRDRYLNTWIVTENGSITDAAQYSIYIERGSSSEPINVLKIKNLRDFFIDDITAHVNHDTIYIDQQTVVVNNVSYIVEGNGIITLEKYYGEHDKLIMKYKVTNLSTGMIDDFGLDGGDASLWNK